MYNPVITECFLIPAVAVKNLDITGDICAHGEKLPYHLKDILPVNNKYCSQCSDMQTDIKKQSPVRLHPENILKYGQMAGTADRQKFCDPLYNS